MAYCTEMLAALVLQTLEKDPTRRLGETAALLSIDRHTVTRALQRHTRRSFREWRQTLLLARAIAALSASPISPIKEISAALGYQSSRSFCRFLCSNTGCTPSAVRRVQLRKRHPEHGAFSTARTSRGRMV
jgi:AraC-like DNA-binding protein